MIARKYHPNVQAGFLYAFFSIYFATTLNQNSSSYAGHFNLDYSFCCAVVEGSSLLFKENVHLLLSVSALAVKSQFCISHNLNQDILILCSLQCNINCLY